MCAMPLTFPVARSRHALVAVVMLWVVAVAGSCERRVPDRAGEHGPRAARIVSLSPAITECAVELGLGDRMVGRTPWCEGVAREVPVVGTLLDVDAEALVTCSPTMVLVQPPAQGIDPALATLAERHGWTVHAWRINGLDDACAAMAGLADAVADADPALAHGVRERHHAWRSGIDEALKPLQETSPARDARVLVMSGGLEGIAFGRGTYIDDALARIGVRNALDRPGYPALSVEDVVRIAPSTIVVIGGSAGRAASHPATEAVPSRVIHVPADGLSVPGGRLPHGLKALRDALEADEGQHGG